MEAKVEEMGDGSKTIKRQHYVMVESHWLELLKLPNSYLPHLQNGRIS